MLYTHATRRQAMATQQRESGSRKRKLVMKEVSKDVSWNIPDYIFLDPTRSLTVGRTSMADVMMHSPKHPSMLSRKHAMFQFVSSSQQWTIEDLKSLNGVYINGKTKINPSTPIPLQAGCEICFGTIVPQNELKYTFIQTDGGSHMLLRVGAKPPDLEDADDSTPCVAGGVKPPLHRDTTPPLSREVTPPLSRHPQDVTPPLARDHQHVTPPLEAPKVKRPCLEANVAVTSHLKSTSSLHSNTVNECVEQVSRTDPLLVGAQSSSETVNVHVTAPPLTPQPDSNVPASASSLAESTANTVQPSTNPQPHLSVPIPTTSAQAQYRSPSLALTSPNAVIDDLFSDSSVEKCFEDLVSDAIFGEEAAHPTSTCSTEVAVGSGGEGHLDGTSIQIQAARDEMQKEKQKLLSNIEALKSELASKERLLVEKSEKVEESKKGVIDSMQEELTCVICQELFVAAHTLSCAHSFCECCIKEWMKSNKRKDCPICRKTITAEPVRSLVLDNAIDKMVEKMDDSTKEERRKLKESHALSLKPVVAPAGGTSRAGGSGVVDMLATASALGVLTRSRTGAGSGPGGSSGVVSSGGSGAGVGTSGSGVVGSGAGVGGSGGSRGGHTRITGAGSVDSPIVLLSDTPPQHRHHPTERYNISSSDEDDEDSSDSEDSEDNESYESGLSGHY